MPQRSSLLPIQGTNATSRHAWRVGTTPERGTKAQLNGSK
jgi:hypothetical protein